MFVREQMSHTDTIPLRRKRTVHMIFGVGVWIMTGQSIPE